MEQLLAPAFDSFAQLPEYGAANPSTLNMYACIYYSYGVRLGYPCLSTLRANYSVFLAPCLIPDMWSVQL